MDVYWFEQTQADVPSANDWLSASEIQLLQGLRFPKRRADWLLGRWTAKNALAICLGHSSESQALKEIEIRTTRSGAPEPFFRNQPARVTVSLSHRAGIGACALVTSQVALGCDLEIIEPRSDAFAGDYFSVEEQALLANATRANRDGLLALLWSCKESALKALREGLRQDTRNVIVSFPGSSMNLSALEKRSAPGPSLSVGRVSGAIAWSQLYVHTTQGQRLGGWWMQSGGLLRTIVADPPPNAPIPLSRECSLAL